MIPGFHKSKLIFIVLLLLSSLMMPAQNLVPNHNFEEFSSCPTGFSQMNASNWFSPAANITPDYFNACGTPDVGVPENGVGFQESSSGAAYVGLYTYSPGALAREYLQVQLSSPTIAGSCYSLSIVYSPVDVGGTSSGLGIYLSGILPTSFDGLQPQLFKAGAGESELEWHTITAQYVSNGEEYLTIGNFLSDENTTWVPGSGTAGNLFAYYYIDSVIVELLSSSPTEIVVDLGPDIEICASDLPITLTSDQPNATNVWNTGEIGTSITVNSPGVYYVQSSIACAFGADSINIVVFEDPELEIEDIFLCSGSDYLIELDGSLGDYLWDDGSTAAEYLITTPGNYGVTLTAFCGEVVEQFAVDVLSIIDIAEPLDLELCETELPFLVDYSSFDDGNNEFLWQDGSSDATFLVTTEGIYGVSIFNDCFEDEVDFSVEIAPSIPSSLDFTDTLKCEGEEIVINTGLTEEDATFLWQDGSTDPTFLAQGPGNYSVIISNFCGSETYDFEISETVEIPLDLGQDVFLCEGDSVLIFSPNGEILNWSTGTVGSATWVSSEGEVIAEGTGLCGGITDTLQVFFNGTVPAIQLPPSVLVCAGDSITLVASNQSADIDFVWNTGETQSSITVFEEGIYIVTGSNNCGSRSDTVLVSIGEFLPDPGLEEIYQLCEGETLSLDVESNGAQIEWSTGSIEESVMLTTDGFYFVSFTNTCKTKIDSFQIVYNIELPELDLGNDLGICPGNTQLIQAENLNGSYIWSDGSTEDSLVVDEAGLYSLQIEGLCNTVTDTIEIFFLDDAPTVDLGVDVSFCEGDSVILSVDSDLTEVVQWSNGSLEDSIIVFEEGIYIAIGINSCGSDLDTISVMLSDQVSQIDLGIDQQICPGDSITLDLGDVIGDVVWSTGEEVASIQIFEAGDYYVSLESNCGTTSDSISIEALPGSPSIDLGEDISFCEGDSVILDIGSVDVDEVIWNTSATENSIIIFTAGTYIVIGNNTCGMDTDTIIAQINNEVPQIELGEDQQICPGDSVTIDIGNAAGEIIWNTGHEGPSIDVFEAGEYFAVLTSSCGSSVDTVLVELLEAIPEVDLGEDQILCLGETLTFDLLVGNETLIEWNNGVTDNENSFQESGLIWVALSNACGEVNDSLQLEIIPAVNPFDLGVDQLICDENSIQLSVDITQTDVNALWNTNENSESIIIMNSGVYWLELTNSCFSFSDTIAINFGLSPSPFDLGESDTICVGETVILEGFQGDEFDYQWQDNSSSSEFAAKETGEYQLIVSSECGTESDQIELTVLQSNEIETPLEDSYVLCIGDSLEIDLSGIVADIIQWNDGSTEALRVLSEAGSYFIELANICSDTLINFTLIKESCIDEEDIFIPNSFTPNEDGINDQFQIFISENWTIQDFNVLIYNRWGEQIFYSKDYDFSWDGSFKGRAVNSGVYAYYIELDVEIEGQGRLIQKAGDITIVK